MYRAAAVKLSWKKAKGYKVDAYEVYRANAKNGKYVKLYTTKNAKKRSFTNGRRKLVEVPEHQGTEGRQDLLLQGSRRPDC